MLMRLDAAIFARVERFSHRSQRLTGMTNFALARIALIGVLVCAIGAATQTSAPTWPIVSAVVSFISLYLTMCWGWYATVEAHYLDGADTAHPYTLLWRAQSWDRLKIILLTIGVTGAALLVPESVALRVNAVLAMPLWLAASYLQCVIPLPPGMSKVREFLESLKPQPQLQPAPVRR